MNEEQNYWPGIVVKQLPDGKLQYTYSKTFNEAFSALGKYFASYSPSYFLQNEHKIQRNLKEKYEQK